MINAVRQLLSWLDMEKNLRRSRPALMHLQSLRLCKLIAYAYEHVSYFHDLMDKKGLRPKDIRGPQDLSLLPVVTKEDLNSLPLKDKISQKVKLADCVKCSTSGSTGMPADFYFRKKDLSAINMNWLRPLLAHGIRPWHKRMEITGPHNISSGKSWYQHLGLWRSSQVSIFCDPREFVAHWRRKQPDFLYGYSGSLKLMAEYMLQKRIDDIRPACIFGVSDLSDMTTRTAIMSAFGTGLIDLYGAAESGCIAWQCPQCPGYHVNMDSVLIEFIRQGRNVQSGERGRVVVTNLFSYAMPVIRYDLGDIGVMSTENSLCGRAFPLMKVIEGRSDACIVLPGGRELSPLFFFGIMKPVRHIEKWKVIQTRMNHISIHVVPKSGFGKADENLILNRCRKEISQDVKISIQKTAYISRERSGKIRAVVSHVKGKIFSE